MEEPYDGLEVFLVADAIHDGFHFGPGTYFTDGSKLYPDPRRREVGWGFCSVTSGLQISTGAYGPVTLDNATVPVAELLAVIFLVEKVCWAHPHPLRLQLCVFWQKTSSHSARNEAHTSHFGPDCSKLCRDIRERSRSLGAKPASPRTISTSLR